MKKLEELDIGETGITDDGLEHLGGLTSLVVLSLHTTAATNAGLKHLEGLRNLETLIVPQTKITEAGAQEFNRSLPQCQVILRDP